MLDYFTTVDYAVADSYKIFNHILNDHVPTIKKFRHIYPVWYTSEIMKLITEISIVCKRIKTSNNIFVIQFK